MIQDDEVEAPEFRARIVFIGDSYVGKTSLINSFVYSKFNDKYETSIGVKTVSCKYDYNNTKVSISIFDTAGDEKYRSLIPLYYKGVQAFICVYDVTNKNSFNNIGEWLKEVDERADEKDPIKFIVGNKIDLYKNDGSCVSTGDALDYTDPMDLKTYFTSARTGENVELLFENVFQLICEKKIFSTERKLPEKETKEDACC
ncbi:small GTP-binding protein [Histomonas meleagridis]|uniref:small GTP-binding protein n=1 Tax=Histomonas meleagridis TaxID=135588 RepID=UPI00355A0C49|nr:small GTP-binding protein [Histomonas meleagridis]KAH0798259.1 small GTP-binding protein [Histomonas meleagridis]